ncbi:MAG: DUF3987 domain-containing protein [Nanopusillaceae archaeon]
MRRVKMLRDMKKRFLEEFSNFTDAPPLYLEASFWFIISSTLGRFLETTTLPTFKIFRPNLWILLSGRTGLTRKSTVIDGSLTLVDEAYKTYFKKIYGPTIKENVLLARINKMKLEFGSTEGVLEHISSTSEFNDTYIFYSHEFGAIISGIKDITYMKMLAPVLSRLYSGEEIIWKGVKKERIIKPGLYTTGLFGIQELWIYTDQYVFQQGLMRRVILVYQKETDKDKWLPPIDYTRVTRRENLLSIGREIGEYMVELEGRLGHSNKRIIVDFEIDASDLINKFAQEREREIMNDYSMYSLYASTIWHHVAKIAMLNAILQREPTISGDFAFLFVKEEDVREAINFIEKTLPRAREMIVRTETRIVPAQIVDLTGPKMLIYNTIKNKCDLGATYTDILNETRLPRDKVKELLVQLLEEEKIIAIEKKSGKKVAVYYYVKELEPKALTLGRQVSIGELKAKWNIT